MLGIEGMVALAIPIVAVSVGVVLFKSFHSAGKQAEQQFPPLSEQDVVFREGRVSGRVNGSWVAAHNALEVVVTHDQLRIKGTHPLFTAIGDAFDMIHCVALSDIISVLTKKRKVEISFRNQRRRVTTLSLNVRDPSALERVLVTANNSLQADRER